MNKIYTILIIFALWVLSILIVFDRAYTQGEYEGYRMQASYTHFKFPKGGYKTTEDLPRALHQYTPFPYNLKEIFKRK